MKTCLVVDDSAVIRKVARRILEARALQISEAGCGQVALNACAASMPDAILFDSHMPPMASVEFLSSLRAMPYGAKPIVIYLTTENDPADIARALTAGADDYLLKPFDGQSLCAKLSASGLIA